MFDLVVCTVITSFVIFSSSFNAFVGNFLQFMIVWFAPWCAIFVIDFLLRRGRYDTAGLMATSSGLYWRQGGVHIPGLVAQASGMAAALLCISTSVWAGPLSTVTGGAAAGNSGRREGAHRGEGSLTRFFGHRHCGADLLETGQ